MQCVECDEEMEGPVIKVRGDFACCMGCAMEYEREILESLKSEEKLRKWLYRPEVLVFNQKNTLESNIQ